MCWQNSNTLITAYCVSTSIGSFIAIVTNGFTILGFKKRDPSMVKPWLYTQIFVTMSTVFIGMVCDIIVHEKSTNAICFMDLTLGSHIVYSVWELYTWFVTKKALLEIMTPRALAMMPNEDQNKIEEIEFTEQQEDLEKVEVNVTQVHSRILSINSKGFYPLLYYIIPALCTSYYILLNA